jgi:hypothetical protein
MPWPATDNGGRAKVSCIEVPALADGPWGVIFAHGKGRSSEDLAMSYRKDCTIFDMALNTAYRYAQRCCRQYAEK